MIEKRSKSEITGDKRRKSVVGGMLCYTQNMADLKVRISKVLARINVDNILLFVKYNKNFV